MDMNAFFRQHLVNLLKDWEVGSDGRRRRDVYTVGIDSEFDGCAQITMYDQTHTIPYKEAGVLVYGLNEIIDLQQKRKDYLERKGQPPEEPLHQVREIGFASTFRVGGPSTEEIVFYGPNLKSGRSEAQHATNAAIEEFIAYWTHQIQVARDYIANGKNRNTNEWSVQTPTTPIEQKVD